MPNKISVPAWTVDTLGRERAQRIILEVKRGCRAAGLPDHVARANAVSILEQQASDTQERNVRQALFGGARA